MRRLTCWTLAVGIAVALAAPTFWTAAVAQDEEALFESRCNSTCHSSDRPKRKRKSAEGWKKTVVRMKHRNNCPITDEEARIIIDYLAKNYGE